MAVGTAANSVGGGLIPRVFLFQTENKLKHKYGMQKKLQYFFFCGFLEFWSRLVSISLYQL